MVKKLVEKPPEKPEVDIDKLLSKGAPVKEDRLQESKKWTFMNLRIAVSMINDVDRAVKKRVGITRTGWILEAIHEKLKRQMNE